MRKLMEIRVACQEAWEVQGGKMRVCMVPFTGRATGAFFNGQILGTGVDTQKFREGEPGQLSARYMLEGKDFTGADCRIFIENSMHDDAGWHPMIVTDSKALAEWEKLPLVATVDGVEGGVLVQVFDPC